MSFSESLAVAAKEYPSDYLLPAKDNPAIKKIERDLPKQLGSLLDLSKYEVKGSVQTGNMSNIPWIAIMDPAITRSTQQGVYIVFLFASDGKTVYLTLNQGAAFLKGRKPQEIEEISRNIREIFYPGQYEDPIINLKAKRTSVGRGYGPTTLISIPYDTDNMPSDDEIKRDLEGLLSEYQEISNYYVTNNLNNKAFYSEFVDGYQASSVQNQTSTGAEDNMRVKEFADQLKQDYNIILRGAPGTGKTYLSNQIAAYIVSDGRTSDSSELTPEELSRIGFVQFHPSYDYTDFVEGMRPITNGNGEMGFELQDGIFKKFVMVAADNWHDSHMTEDDIEKETNANASIDDFLDSVEKDSDVFHLKRGGIFKITESDDDELIEITMDYDIKVPTVTLKKKMLARILSSGQKFDSGKDIAAFFGRSSTSREDNYYYALYSEISNRSMGQEAVVGSVDPVEEKSYVFLIDEINRGEISKIFGELFFSIDPDYRGTASGVFTQYSNLHDDPLEKFYIPKNVYILGTMNDIDRSVDTFDFAMRRRFTFEEVTAKDSQAMLKTDAAKTRMDRLNSKLISDEIGLNEDYQIGSSYFKKLVDEGGTVSVNDLWDNRLKPLLKDYFRGERNAATKLTALEKAYFGVTADDDSIDG
jgi:hypothetical protein